MFIPDIRIQTVVGQVTAWTDDLVEVFVMKRMGSVFSFGLVLAFAMSMSGCILLPLFQKQVFGLGDALVVLPGAITSRADQPGAALVASRSSSAVIESVQSIYAPVRDNYNEIANNAIEFTRELLQSIDENLFGNRQLKNYVENNGEVVFNDGLQAWRITQTGTDFTVSGWENVASAWYPTVHIAFSQEGERLSGEVIAIQTPEDSASPIYRVVFDNADPDYDGAMTTELEAVNLDYNNIDQFNIPTKLWLHAYARDVVFQIAASVYYTELNLSDGEDAQSYLMAQMKDPIDGPYVIDESGIAGLYQYRGTFEVNAEVDRGSIDLALVPGYTDPALTDEFAEYSVGALWKEAIAEWIRNDDPLQDSINSIAVPTIGPASSTQEIFDALLDVQASLGPQESHELDNILFVVLLTNPAYFDNAFDESFVGTAELDPPAWASDLPDVAPLAIQRDQETMPALTVAFPAGLDSDPPPETEF